MPEIIGTLFEPYKGVFPDIATHSDGQVAAIGSKLMAGYVAERIRSGVQSEMGHLLIRLDDGELHKGSYNVHIPEENLEGDIHNG